MLRNNEYIVRKLNTNKTQILHRIRFRKYNPENPHEDSYREAQWRILDNIVLLQDDLYTVAWEAKIGGYLFDKPIIHADNNATDFDESHTHGSSTVIVPHSFFHNSSDGHNKESCPAPDSSVVYP